MPIRIRKEENDLSKLAKMMFEPAGKQPYYKGGRALRNLQELVDNLGSFSKEEAAWVASWIEYLGDAQTAQKIKGSAADFKNVIQGRHSQLKRLR